MTSPAPAPEPATGRSWLTLAYAVLIVGIGDLLIALADIRGRDRLPGPIGLYWLGIVLIYVPVLFPAWRLRRSPRALAFLSLVLVAGIYIVRILVTPTKLATVDELQTLRSLNDLQNTHHLFAVNPIVGTYSRFPGSQIVVVALHQLTGLNFSAAGKVLIGTEHLMLALALFALFRLLLDDLFAAFVAVVVYTVNSSFAFFDAEVAYEAFALPLAIVVLYLLVTAARSEKRDARILTVCACAVGIVVAVSHHMTSYWLAVVLLVWTVAALVRRRWRLLTGSTYIPWVPAALLTGFALIWFVFVARTQLRHELGPVFNASFNSIESALRGKTGVKHPFTASGTAAGSDPKPLQYVGYLAVAVSVVVLVAGLLRLIKSRSRTSLSVTLLLLGAIYPVGLALRLTSASTETSSRTAEFSFVGVALAAGWLLVFPRLRERAAARAPSARRWWLLPLALGIVATGDIVVGQAPYDRYAGPYLVDADIRSVTTPGQQAAEWAAQHWPRGAVFTATDVTTGLLVASAGDFRPKTGAVDGLPVGYIFDSPAVDGDVARIIQVDKIRYLVVDRRVTTVPSPKLTWPLPSADGRSTRSAAVLPAAYLQKLATVPQLELLYDNGVIGIYQVVGNLP